MDLVSQASPVATETTTVVCSVQVHTQRPPPEELEEAEEAGEALASSQDASTGDLPESSSHGDVRVAAAAAAAADAEGQTALDMPATGDQGKPCFHFLLFTNDIHLHLHLGHLADAFIQSYLQ